MTVIATALKHLMAAGMTGEALIAAIAEIEAAQGVKADAVAEKRRAYDRERKRNKKANSTGIPPESTETAESAETAPPNDIYSNPPVNPIGAKAPTSPFSETVRKAWNDGPGSNGATKANALTPSRRKHLSSRVKEVGEDGVLRAIAAIGRSKFHCGEGFTADLGWFLGNSERVAKWLEKAGTASTADAKPRVTDHAAYLASLENKPWLNATPRAEQPRNGNTGPPRPIGALVPGITSNAQAA